MPRRARRHPGPGPQWQAAQPGRACTLLGVPWGRPRHRGQREGTSQRGQAPCTQREGEGPRKRTREDVVSARLLAGPDQEGPGLRARGLQSVQGLRAGDAAKEPPGEPEPTLTLCRPRGDPPPPQAPSPDPQLPSDAVRDPAPPRPPYTPSVPGRWFWAPGKAPVTRKGSPHPVDGVGATQCQGHVVHPMGHIVL